jgi:hypothetical protein
MAIILYKIKRVYLMKKILIMIVCLGLASCSNGSYSKTKGYDFSYPYDESLMVKVPTTNKHNIHVKEFSDYRGNDGRYQKLWDGIIFNPYFVTFRDRPENKYIKDTDTIMYHDLHYNIDVTKDLSNATKESLLKSELFTNNKSINGYTLKGRVLEFKYHKKHYLYGLSGFVIIPQMLGTPVTKNTFSIKVEFSLIDNKDNKEVFSKVYSKKDKINVGFYYGSSEELWESFSKVYQSINNDLVYDLDVLLSKK